MGFMTKAIQTKGASKKQLATANKVANIIVAVVMVGILVCVGLALSGVFGSN